MKHRSLVLACLTPLLLLGLAHCGGDDDSSSTSTTSGPGGGPTTSSGGGQGGAGGQGVGGQGGAGGQGGGAQAVCATQVAVKASGDTGEGCAILSNGAGHCWSVNQGVPGQIDEMALPSPSPQITHGINVLGAYADGTVWQIWGSGGVFQIEGISEVARVDSENRHACALRADGSVWCWGENPGGALGNGQTSPAGTYVPPGAVSDAGPFQDLSVGENHSCAVKNGQILCWGNCARGQCGTGAPYTFPPYGPLVPTPVTLDAVERVFAGGMNTCARVAGGAVYCWGANDRKQVGDVPQMSVGAPMLVDHAEGAVELAIGAGFICALRADGTVACWGKSDLGVLGQAVAAPESATPVEVTGVTGATHIDANGDYVCAIVSDGSVSCWGAGSPDAADVGLPCP